MNQSLLKQHANDIIALNRLTKSQRGIWVAEGEADHFDYSDGAESEQYLRSVFANASDLSSLSVELEEKIRDWPSEYHLSKKRGHLLRCFDFSKAQNVLELGCGCGAITHYLGDQQLTVHAVEGSSTRAELAALRTRDLSNVNVIHSNFNDLQLPDKYYDVAFSIGVLEYAKRFYPADVDHKTAVKSILSTLLDSVTDDGTVVVAIENRLGLKYLLGAGEDHYYQPDIGLFNYLDEQEIRTYSRKEWLDIADELETNATFLYPFPDYKIPSVVLTDSFLQQNEYAYSLLSSMTSRDYCGFLEHNRREYLIWKSLHAQRQIGAFSNSFLLVIAKSDTASKQIIKNEFIYVSSGSRKSEFQTLTEKPMGVAKVSKSNLHTKLNNVHDTPLINNIFHQTNSNEDYLDGQLLSERWFECVQIYIDDDKFKTELQRFVDFIRSEQSKNDTGQLFNIDLLPKNIIIASDGQYRAFDKEWITNTPVSVELLLFRAALHFVTEHRFSLATFCANQKISTTDEFIEWCFEAVRFDYYRHKSDLTRLEEKFQQAVNKVTVATKSKLGFDQPIGKETFTTTLYWSASAEFDSTRDYVSSWGVKEAGVQTIRFDLPASVANVQWFKLVPANATGYLKFSQLLVSAIGGSGVRTELLNIKGANSLNELVYFNDLRLASDTHSHIFTPTGDDPYLLIDLTASTESFSSYCVELQMAWSQSEDRQLVDSYYHAEIEKYCHRQSELHAQNRFIRQTLTEQRDDAERRADESQVQAERARAELAVIKQSRVWRWAESGRFWFYKKLLANVPALQQRLLVFSRKKVSSHHAVANNAFKGAEVLATGSTQNTADDLYQRYVQQTDIDETQRIKINNDIASWSRKPKISIVMPTYNVSPNWLKLALASVNDQLYGHWELCLVDDCSDQPETIRFLNSIKNPKIRLRRLQVNKNIAAATNEAIAMATGDYVAFMDHDDKLSIHALYEVVKAINEHDADFIYSDEDFVTADDQRTNPHFKPDFSPDLLLSHNYITHLVVVKKSLLERVGSLRSEFDGAQDYDFVIRATEVAEKIHHIPKVLYHWRMTGESTSLNAEVKPLALERGRRAVSDALDRRKEPSEVFNADIPHFFRIKRKILAMPRVSIVIVLDDDPETLRNHFIDLREKTTYQNYDVCVVIRASDSKSTDMGHDLTLLDSRFKLWTVNEEKSFADALNYAAYRSRGEHLVFLGQYVTPLTWDWLESLLEYSQLERVGIVGGKILTMDNTIANAGLVVGMNGMMGKKYKNFSCHKPGYFNRPHIAHNVSAMSGDLMMTKRSCFEHLGGFDQEHFGENGADIDFCLRALIDGFDNVMTPHAQARYTSSKESDLPPVDSFSVEAKAEFQRRYSDLLEQGDPFHNPNLSYQQQNFAIKV